MISIFKKFDMYGAVHLGRIRGNEIKQKSIFGGIFTLLLHLLGLSYFLAVMYQWYNGYILPKSENKLHSQNHTNYTIESDFISFASWRQGDNTIDPFQETNNILMPFLIYYIGGIAQTPVPLLGTQKGLSPYNSNLISLQSFTLIQNLNFDDKFNTITEVMIYIGHCQPKFLKLGQSCASDEQIFEYYQNATTYLSFWFDLKYFDVEERQTKSVKKQIYFFYQKDKCYNAQIMIKLHKIKIDDGFLFHQSNDYEIISDFTLFPYLSNDDILYQILGMKLVVALMIRLDTFKELQEISYPKIGEILAQVGSVVGVLMLLKEIIYMYNEYTLQEHLINEIITIYYPQFTQLKIHKNIFGRIKSVAFNNKQVDLKKFRDWYYIAREKAISKLQINNTLYELTRIQYTLKHLVRENNIPNLDNMGLKLDFLENKFISKSIPNELSPKNNVDSNLDQIENASLVVNF